MMSSIFVVYLAQLIGIKLRYNLICLPIRFTEFCCFIHLPKPPRLPDNIHAISLDTMRSTETSDAIGCCIARVFPVKCPRFRTQTVCLVRVVGGDPTLWSWHGFKPELPSAFRSMSALLGGFIQRASRTICSDWRIDPFNATSACQDHGLAYSLRGSQGP